MKKTIITISLFSLFGCNPQSTSALATVKEKIIALVKKPTHSTSGMSQEEYRENARLWAIKDDNVVAARKHIEEAVKLRLKSPKHAIFEPGAKAIRVDKGEIETGQWCFETGSKSLNWYLLNMLSRYVEEVNRLNAPPPPPPTPKQHPSGDVVPSEEEPPWAAEDRDTEYRQLIDRNSWLEPLLGLLEGVEGGKVELHYYAIESYVDTVNQYATDIRMKYTGYYIFNPYSGGSDVGIAEIN